MEATKDDCMMTLIREDALRWMQAMQGTPFGAVITDPPYASGGSTMTAKQQSTAKKYTSVKKNNPLPDFEGDAMDQRSWMNWITEVLREARRLCIPGAPLCAFVDWRQLPALTDAVQRAGWCWRGVAVWDKVNSRPQRGRFRQQAEFVTWASNGAMPPDRGVAVLPGVLTHAQIMTAHRSHQTEKPLELMRQIVRITEPGKVIFDPFMGSGTTLLAAAMEGYDSIGVELSKVIYEIAVGRIIASGVTPQLLSGEGGEACGAC